MGHITDRDFEVLNFLLDVAMEALFNRYKYNGAVMSGGMQELIKRAGQIQLIIKGRADEIKEYHGDPSPPPEETLSI